MSLRVVRAPLTFGHSQLTVRTTTREWQAFRLAGEHVWRAIRVYCHVFSGKSPLHEVRDGNPFNPLARYTHTSGDYVKTVILRTSANESGGQYKMHLAPYFTSHASECRGDFQERDGRPKRLLDGDLISWFGKREREADIIEFDFESKVSTREKAAEARIKPFQLQKLADELDQAWLYFERHGWEG